MADERGLAGDAKPNSILPDPCIGQPSMPRKSFSAFNSSLFENSGHHRAVAIQTHRDILVDNLVGTYSAGFDAFQELSLVGERAVELGVDESRRQHLIQRVNVFLLLGEVPGAFQRHNLGFVSRNWKFALGVERSASKRKKQGHTDNLFGHELSQANAKSEYFALSCLSHFLLSYTRIERWLVTRNETWWSRSKSPD